MIRIIKLKHIKQERDALYLQHTLLDESVNGHESTYPVVVGSSVVE